MSKNSACSPPPALVAPTVLHLRPQPEAAVYEARITWEAYANGEYQRTTISKEITLRVAATAAGFAFAMHTSPPTLTKPEDLEPLENMALRLASLYEHVEVQAAPTGEVTGLLNYEALRQTWTQLAQSLRAATVAHEEVSEAILGFLDRQLQNPAQVLASLRHDYLYQVLLPGCYEQPLGEPTALPQLRQFANFFDKTSLWFTETTTVQAAAEPGHFVLRRHGPLDAQRTDVAAVVRLIDQALCLASPPVGTAPLPAILPAPHFHYEATYVLEAATGLLQRAALSLYARAGLLFNKEYTLTLTRQ